MAKDLRNRHLGPPQLNIPGSWGASAKVLPLSGLPCFIHGMEGAGFEVWV